MTVHACDASDLTAECTLPSLQCIDAHVCLISGLFKLLPRLCNTQQDSTETIYACLHVAQVSDQISTAARVPVVTAVQRLAGFSVATFDAAAQSAVRPLEPEA